MVSPEFLKVFPSSLLYGIFITTLPGSQSMSHWYHRVSPTLTFTGQLIQELSRIEQNRVIIFYDPLCALLVEGVGVRILNLAIDVTDWFRFIVTSRQRSYGFVITRLILLWSLLMELFISTSSVIREELRRNPFSAFFLLLGSALFPGL